MKKLSTILLSLCVAVLAWSCSDSNANKTNIEKLPVVQDGQEVQQVKKHVAKFDFEEETYDFGSIKQGDKVDYTFKFTNTGNAPLIINDIKVTCGCTTPKWSKDPVEPGQKGFIEVNFNSEGKANKQHKPITIYSNVPGEPKVVALTGYVEYEEVNGPFRK